jgi:hypothetical protein
VVGPFRAATLITVSFALLPPAPHADAVMIIMAESMMVRILFFSDICYSFFLLLVLPVFVQDLNLKRHDELYQKLNLMHYDEFYQKLNLKRHHEFLSGIVPVTGLGEAIIQMIE